MVLPPAVAHFLRERVLDRADDPTKFCGMNKLKDEDEERDDNEPPEYDHTAYR